MPNDPVDRQDADGGTDGQLLDRLRKADAKIEELQHLILSQETMANELTMATEELARASHELAQQAQMARGGRSLYRLVSRLRRRLGPATTMTPAPLTLESGWTHESDKLTDSRYHRWIDLYDTLDEDRRGRLTARLASLPDSPTISVIVPVYNTPEAYLRQAIESVRAQLFKNWELCISDDCSTLEHVSRVLDEFAALDPRIRICRRDVNGHISASSNSALSLAKCTWICLMDHDDVLAEHALAMAVLAIAAAPDAGILYSDEDHIDADGIRSAPYFKPDFDPLLILGQNYFSHMTMLRKDLVDAVGGFREGYEGSQDWDLVLRVIDTLRPEQIVHVPHVLYHWRAHAASTASTLEAKPYVVEASRRVVQEHLDRIGVGAKVTTVWGSSFNRINWEIGQDPPLVSVVVLPRDGVRLRRCVESIRTVSTYPHIEIILIDDGGYRPPMRHLLRDRSAWLTIIENTEDLSDSAQRNLAARSAKGQILVFVHDDVEVLGSAWLEEVIGTLAFPNMGCVGIKLLYPDMKIQHAGIALGIGGTVGHPHRLFYDRFDGGYSGRLLLMQSPSAVSWACMAVRRDVFESVGGFSEDHFTGMFGDVDFCLRLRESGWRVGWTPHAEMIHYERPEDSRGADGENAVRFDRDIRYLNQRWREWLQNDPAYNPNLSLAHETFLLAWPPRRSIE
jgi:O-antigen biosynthesis protein